jgi:serine phosphatase RsbU (regulator of sigma subunit)
LLSNRNSYFVYFLPYTVFVAGTLYFKKSIPLLQDNLINGSALTFVSWYLSRMIYKNTVGNLVKQKIIEKQKNDIQKERNELRKNYSQLEEELSLARKIQNLLIPRSNPMPGVASLYKPMSQVGGDFFDYIVFRESNELGIFLSDVSGHGVPAAFITSMIKSFILQSRHELKDPAEFFRKLNDHLYQHTNDNFITAFYGILNFDTKLLRYTNAGHCHPIVIDNGGSRYIEIPDNGFPLAVMNAEQMTKIKKDFANYEVSLKGVGKLVLYTDGLTEADGIAGSDGDFETTLISTEMSEHCKTPPSDFIELVYKQLVDFHGSELFDDDICMICVDL